jgi:hypothetical protein
MKEIVVLVRSMKSLGWEKSREKAAPTSCPFFQNQGN